MENNFNDYENKFLEDLKIIDSYIPAGYELEIDRWCGDDDFIPGWYAMKYSEKDGCAYPLNEYYFYTEPIITEAEAIEKEIDVEKCLDYYGCYYVG